MLVATKLVLQPQHPQTRFVSREAIALCLGRSLADIERVDCWRYVMHVVGKKFSTFISYADMPPILGVSVPIATDVRLWRKRWRKHSHLAPRFWLDFYQQKFQAVSDLGELADWDELVAYIHFGLTASDQQTLEKIAAEITDSLMHQAA